MKVSVIPDIILCGWLGLKRPNEVSMCLPLSWRAWQQLPSSTLAFSSDIVKACGSIRQTDINIRHHTSCFVVSDSEPPILNCIALHAQGWSRSKCIHAKVMGRKRNDVINISFLMAVLCHVLFAVKRCSYFITVVFPVSAFSSSFDGEGLQYIFLRGCIVKWENQ